MSSTWKHLRTFCVLYERYSTKAFSTLVLLSALRRLLYVGFLRSVLYELCPTSDIYLLRQMLNNTLRKYCYVKSLSTLRCVPYVVLSTWNVCGLRNVFYVLHSTKNINRLRAIAIARIRKLALRDFESFRLRISCDTLCRYSTWYFARLRNGSLRRPLYEIKVYEFVYVILFVVYVLLST